VSGVVVSVMIDIKEKSLKSKEKQEQTYDGQ